MDNMTTYLPILQALQTSGVAYRVIGTWALKAYFPVPLQDYVLQDCDIAIAPDLANIRKAIEVLEQNAWRVTVWDEPVPTDVFDAFWVGKYYLRGRQASLVLDLAYECALAWDALATSPTWFEGVPLASIPNILALKRAKAIDKGNLEAFEKWLDIFM
ncbi:MAG: hypothetical protein EAZ95_13125 [Bacteroidetes bacterium]|nr:MAG: hypothetical protein EAZ95_13125 [Bacteroidota bacterium]